ncbi:MAG: META domain-containing protein [Paludibacter sp.]|nr:META domain-containing protein [Bacteroidales bacterium]MCM1069264.1 META domain-containing protein [Prevotella sp.]MCM1353753.1 META domain-containing protein [Bacteroides sp.]MCM1442179.1 META domain-containing protein [Muribaculum sp.]MCM1482524.1 META domain-containing protein [Paludibacter sp.]
MKKQLMYLFSAALLLSACGKQQKGITSEQLNGRWNIVSVNDSNIVSVETDEISAEVPNLYFSVEDSLFACYAGCNRMGGSLILEENTISLGDMFSTRMYCEDAMELEDLLGSLLPQVTQATLSETGELLLTDANGNTLLQLTKSAE